MFPTFGRVFGEPIPAYFTLLMVGFVVATFLGARWAKRSRQDHNVIIDLGLVSVIAGVAGARILHVLADGYFWDYVHLCTDPVAVVWRDVTTPGECRHFEGAWDSAKGLCHAARRDCFAWLKFWNGGLTYYGGLAAAALYGLWFLKREAFPIWKAADMAGMMIPLGLFWGRLGCFFGGCCFGSPTDHGFGVSFPPGSAASRKQFELNLIESKDLPSLPVHPTQLYEAAGCLVIAFIAAVWIHPHKRFDGQVFCVFLALYAGLRFALEYLRADDRGSLFGLSTSQFLGLAVVGASLMLWNYLSRRSKRLLQLPG
ncbi:MAG: prolipoprotein diacylglyceryl transferase [Deltaproteobacteria bacterium]|nr:prolipoprotein diacylglyceryl transferase [Deltaproteobacteria bacterium]